MKEKIAAIVERTTEAIDFTPIHYFQTIRPLRSGTILRWDTAEKKILIDDESFKSRDNVED